MKTGSNIPTKAAGITAKRHPNWPIIIPNIWAAIKRIKKLIQVIGIIAVLKNE